MELHQLSNGLYVSGKPEPQRERLPTMSSKAIAYTGGDVTKSGELGRMFDIPVVDTTITVSGPKPVKAGSMGSNSGPLPSKPGGRSDSQKSNSGPQTPRKTSGSLPGGATLTTSKQCSNSGSLPATGLITSGPLSSSGAPIRKLSGSLDPSSSSSKLVSHVAAHSQGITNLSNSNEFSMRSSIPKAVVWTVIPLFLMSFLVGAFILVVVHNYIMLVAAGGVFGAVVMLMAWNACWGRKARLASFIASYPDTHLGNAANGQYVKVTGVVTCGSVPLESSYQKVSRCVYISTGLYEYRGWNSMPANPNHRHFTWGHRYISRHVADFYISESQSGLRALVKAGNGAKVSSFVDTTTVVDLNAKNRDLSPEFVRWLGEQNLSSDDRVMRLKEGYVKEGSIVSVMGVIRRNQNVLAIVPPPEPVSSGCLWGKFLLPASVVGLVLRCPKDDAIPV